MHSTENYRINEIFCLVVEFPTYLTRACKDKFAEAFAQIDCGFPLSHDKVNKMVLAQKMNRLERENEMAQRQC